MVSAGDDELCLELGKDDRLKGQRANIPRGSGKDAGTDAPAVAYVRMSTDHQKYSTENQLDIIRNYANARGLKILRVFEDSGRSGLRLEGREALQGLVAEVKSGRADFEAILVYNFSRWRRFQDADEGGYCEHECSRVGKDHLQLTVIKGYLAKLLGNARVMRYLMQHRPEFLPSSGRSPR